MNVDFGKVIPAPGATRDAASFIVDTFAEVSAVDYFGEPQFAQLRTLAAQHSWTEIAAEIVKRLHDAGTLIR